MARMRAGARLPLLETDFLALNLFPADFPGTGRGVLVSFAGAFLAWGFFAAVLCATAFVTAGFFFGAAVLAFMQPFHHNGSDRAKLLPGRPVLNRAGRACPRGSYGCW